MLRSVPEAMRINAFVEVRIPKASVLFMKYGEKISGHYSSTADDIGIPEKINGGSVISQLAYAQNFLEAD